MSRAGGRLAALALVVVALATATAVVWTDDHERQRPRGRPAPVVLDGRALFAAKGCEVCHLGPGAERGGGIGPDLRSGARVAGSRVPGLDARAYLRQSILSPGAFVAPGAGGFGAMPLLGVTPAEADALVAYLLSARERRNPGTRR